MFEFPNNGTKMLLSMEGETGVFPPPQLKTPPCARREEETPFIPVPKRHLRSFSPPRAKGNSLRSEEEKSREKDAYAPRGPNFGGWFSFPYYSSSFFSLL